MPSDASDTMSLIDRLRNLIRATTPVVGAPMAGPAGGQLAAAISQAGGFGFVGAASFSLEGLKQQLDLIPEGVPYGVGFLGWLLDKLESQRESLAFTLSRRPKAVCFAFGDDLQKYVKQVQDFNQTEPLAEPVLTVVQVNFLRQVQEVVDWGVDIIILQGNEAGGHGHGSAPPVLDLLNEVISAGIANLPPILVAGGFTSGKQLAEVLRKGADGIVVGTAFLCASESLYSDEKKAIILATDSTETVRSVAFDQAVGTAGWPEGVDGRAVDSAVVAEYADGLSLDERQQRFKARGEKDKTDKSGMVVWAGKGVGSVTKIRPAAEIIAEIRAEALANL